MKVLVTALMAAAVLLLMSSPSPGVVHQKDIQILGGTLSGPLSNFPVMVKLTSERVDYGQFQSDGSDLRFYQGATQLAHEIESFDTAGDSFVWVKVPTVTAGGKFTMKWGDTVGSPLDPTGVWSNGYIGVYHMNETAGSTIYDSTAGATNGALVGTPTVDATGAINGGMYFDGTVSIGGGDGRPAGLDDAVNLGDTFEALSAMTAEGWANANTDGERFDSLSGLFAKGDQSPGWWAPTWHMQVNEDNRWIRWQIADDDNNARIGQVTENSVLTPGTWQHIAGTWDGGTTSASTALYVDGAQPTATPEDVGGFVAMRDTNPGRAAVIGTGMKNDSYMGFEGYMDEVRFSDVGRSADWVMASYLSGADQFLSWGDGPCRAVDWNDDGLIDDLDLTELAVHWQQSVPAFTQGDADGDGFVDDLDLTALAVCWPGGDLDVSAIPEPATLSLLVLGGVALLRRKRS